MPQAANQISEARLAANQVNAQLSTGPTSAAGKATSSEYRYPFLTPNGLPPKFRNEVLQQAQPP